MLTADLPLTDEEDEEEEQATAAGSETAVSDDESHSLRYEFLHGEHIGWSDGCRQRFRRSLRRKTWTSARQRARLHGDTLDRRLWSCGAVPESPLGSHIAAEDADTLILGKSDVSSTPAKTCGRDEALLMMPVLLNLAVSVMLMLTPRLACTHDSELTTACTAS